eukprot:jgi/Galph1/676/GphlegSOOS_G5439.1
MRGPRMLDKTPLQAKVLSLYRVILRQVQKLPTETQPYYRYYVKQQFKSHVDEDDEEKISLMIQKSHSYVSYILNKVRIVYPFSNQT